MADTTKNIVNQYSYNSPYVKTLTEEQVEVLYPTRTPVPKNLLLHIKNNAQVDYFVIGDGNTNFNSLPKYGRQIIIKDSNTQEKIYSNNYIKYSDYFILDTQSNSISLNTNMIADKTAIETLSNAIDTNIGQLLNCEKYIYDPEVFGYGMSDEQKLLEKYNYTNTTWTNTLNDSTKNPNKYPLNKSYYLYNFTNCIYKGTTPIDITQPYFTRFYTFCPLEQRSDSKVPVALGTSNLGNFIRIGFYSEQEQAWIVTADSTPTGQELLRFYFAPKTNLNNTNYSLNSFYPYLWFKISNNNIKTISIYNEQNNQLFTNTEVYWVQSNNENTPKIKGVYYLGTINNENNITFKNNSGGGGSPIDENKIIEIITNYLNNGHFYYDNQVAGGWVASEMANQEESKNLAGMLPGKLEDKLDKTTADFYYIKKPTTENKEGWTTLNGTGISATDSDSKIKYEFKVYDYKSQPTEN